MATRIHRLAGVCLLTTGLLMSCMSGAIASADSENNAKSGSSPSTNSSTNAGGRTSTTSTAKTDTSAEDPVAAAEHDLKSTGVSGASADKSTSTVSAQTNTSSGTASTVSTASTAELPASPETSRTAAAEPSAVAVTADPSPTAGLQIQTPLVAEILAGTDAPSESAANSTANSTANSAASDATTSSSDTAESAQPLASTSSATSSAASSATASATSSATASVTATAENTSTPSVGTTSTAAPAATVSEASVAIPTFREAVVYFLRVLASAKNFVDAIMRLPAEIRAVLGIPWSTPSVGDYHALMSTPNVAVLNLLVVSLSQAASDPGSPLAVHGGGVEADGGITLLTAQRQQLAPAPLAAPAPPHRSVPTVINDTIAAIVVSLSLWSIFYAALPGLGGLLSFGAAGVRIGYRQANAEFALHTTEMARFLRPGPIGVVRTGSLVSVHSRTTPTSGRTTQRRHFKPAA